MKKILLICLLLNYVLLGAMKTHSKEGLYRVPTSIELLEPGIEDGAYEDFLRVVDEINKNKGRKVYLDGFNSFNQNYEKIDLVPIAQYGNEGDDEFDKELGQLSKEKNSKVKYKAYSIYEIDNNPDKLLTPENKADLGFLRVGSSKRFYFGNNNRVKDIIIANESDFNKIDKNNVLYEIDGVYKTISKKSSENLNPLKITLDEYFSKINGKSPNDKSVLEFIKTKMKESANIDTIIENNELKTVDKNGNKHRVLWNFEPISIPNDDYFLDMTSDKRYNNVVLNNVYIYSPMQIGGKLLYTKDGSIIIQDTLEGKKDTFAIKEGWGSAKDMQEMQNEYKNNPDSWDIPDKLKEYFKAKASLSKEEFDKQYGSGLLNDETFKSKYASYQSEISKELLNKENIDKTLNDLKAKSKNIENNPNFPEDYYRYINSWYSESDKQAYFNSLNQNAQNLLTEYAAIKSELDKNEEESYKLYTQINETIPKQYGFYDGWSASDDEKKYISKMVLDKNLFIKKISKNIEFRGKGRIDGTIDFGYGENYLTITEQTTGKFGTNITFGPNVKLKNIKAIRVGGQEGAATGSQGLSGKTSLSIEVDPNKLDSEGYIYQHALKDTWTNDNKIIFSSSNTLPDYINDFGIEMKVSSISKDSIINVGRPLVYLANPLASIDQSANNALKINELYKYQITLFSDSITHQINPLNKTSKDGNSLVQVKIVDKLKRLSNEENEVFKSMKDSGYLGSLTDTLSSSTKKTIFSAEEDKLESDKIKKLINSLVSKETPDEIISKLSHFEYKKTKEKDNIAFAELYTANSDNASDRYTLIVDSINELRNNKDVILFNKIEENLNKYQKIDFSSLIDNINNLKLNSLVSNGKIVDRNLATETGVKNKIEELKQYYEENIEPFYKKLEAMKPDNTNEDVKQMIDLRDKIQELGFESTYWIPDPDKKLSEYLEKFSDVKEKVKKLKALRKDDLLKQLQDALVRLQYSSGSNQTYAYKNLVENLYYTQREEESLRELKTLITQINKKNIYSEVNKISKNSLDVFTPLVFNNLSNDKDTSKAGVISSRYSKDKFKGNLYTAYGLYEFLTNERNLLGVIIGASNSSHKEVRDDTLKQLTTESKIVGKRAYLGLYDKFKFNNNIIAVMGLGAQYSKVNVDRDFRNNYQRQTFKGKLNTIDFNVYGGGVYKYELDDDLVFTSKAMLSYALINQGKIKENKKPLSINVDKKSFSYLDFSLGFGLSKMIYSDDSTSSISADVYGIHGISGYNNANLNARFDNSNSSFSIKGNKYKKDSLKVLLQYNVLKTNGLDYGLKGDYFTNKNENNIAIEFKISYRF